MHNNPALTCLAHILVVLMCLQMWVGGCQQNGLSAFSPIKDYSDRGFNGSRVARSDPGSDGDRLPTNIRPVHYDLKLQPFMDNDTYVGQVTIRLQILIRTSNITLHSDNITIHDTQLETRTGGTAAPNVQGINHSSGRQLLIIRLDSDLAEGSEYDLTLNYWGYFSSDLAGLYKASYVDPSGKESWLALTQMQPAAARRVFPCFDEPAMKATFGITLVRPQALTSLSNMRRTASIESEQGWIEDKYETTVKMSTYLVAFAICDFSFLEDTQTSTSAVRIWAQPDLINQGSYALYLAPRVLNFFEDFFNISYPLPKLDIIAGPKFEFTAMENWGLITYLDSYILHDNVTSAKYTETLARVLSHEIAHQWFGNLVTMEWWNDLWLNEGFASYVEFLGAEAVEPTWNISEQFTVRSLNKVMEMDAFNTSHPISSSTNSLDEIGAQFDEITYLKGSSVIRMMDHFLTRDIFRKGLSNYLEARKYDSATQDMLWTHLTEAAKNCTVLNDTDVKTVMDKWTLQTGFPVVTASRDYEDQSITITQRRFLYNKHQEDLVSRWDIPITFTTATDKAFHATLPKQWLWSTDEKLVLNKTDQVPSAEDWVIINLHQTGYYRVNYDTYNWNLLIQQLKEDHAKIHVVNRGQILNDALNLARGGHLNYNLALSATKYLTQEHEFVPLKAAFDSLEYITAMLDLTEMHGRWKMYMAQLIKPMYQKLGFFESTSDTVPKQLTRSLVVRKACDFEIYECIQSAQKIYYQWMRTNDTKATISANVREAAICTAIRHGGVAEWEFAWNRFRNSTSSSERENILRGMTCTRQPWLLTRLLRSSLQDDRTMRSKYVEEVLRRIGRRNSVGRYIALDFFINNWHSYIKKFSLSFILNKMVYDATYVLNTPEELFILRQFVDSHEGQLAAATRSFHQAIESTQVNIQWMKDYYPTITHWLEKNTR